MSFVGFDKFSKAMQNNLHMYAQKTVFFKLPKLLASKLSSGFNIWASQIQNSLLNKKYKIISIIYFLDYFSILIAKDFTVLRFWLKNIDCGFYSPISISLEKNPHKTTFPFNCRNNFLRMIISLFLLQHRRMWIISMLWIIVRHQK